MSEHKLISQNRTEAEKLYAETRTAVYFICYAILGDIKNANKVTADIYLKVFANPEKLSEIENISKWILRAAATASASFLKSKNKDVFASLKNEENYQNAALSENPDCYDYIFTTITLLSPICRLSAICYHFCKMNTEQITKIAGVNAEAVNLSLKRVNLSVGALSKHFDNVPDITDALKTLATRKENTCTCKFADVCFYPESEEALQEPKNNKKNGLIYTVIGGVALCAVLLFVGITVSKHNPPKEEVKAPEQVVSSAPIAEQIGPSDTPLYVIRKQSFYNADGERTKTEEYTYKNGKVKTAKFSSAVYTETLSYTYKDGGAKRKVKNNKGVTVETASLDKNGNPTKLVFTKDTVNIKWNYTYKDGKVITASYIGNTKGKYSYTYTALGQVETVTHKEGGDKYIIAYTYDDQGMVKTREETDPSGETVTYDYIYNYSELNFTCTCTNGKKIVGIIAKK